MQKLKQNDSSVILVPLFIFSDFLKKINISRSDCNDRLLEDFVKVPGGSINFVSCFTCLARTSIVIPWSIDMNYYLMVPESLAQTIFH